MNVLGPNRSPIFIRAKEILVRLTRDLRRMVWTSGLRFVSTARGVIQMRRAVSVEPLPTKLGALHRATQPKLLQATSSRLRPTHVVARKILSEACLVRSEVPGLDPEQIEFLVPERMLTLLEGVTVLSRHGIAETHTRRLVRDTLVMPGKFEEKLKAGKFSEKLPVVQFDAPVAVIPFFNNYYINWREAILRLPALFEPEVSQFPEVVLAYNDDFALGGADLLQQVVPDNVKVVQIPRKTRVAAPLFIFLSQVESLAIAPEAVTGLRSIFAPLLSSSASPSGDIIHIARKPGAIRRSPENLHELVPLLEQRGVRTLHLEDYSLIDQVRLTHNAAIVIAQHGAGLSSLLLSQPGQRILEIHSNSAHEARQHYRAFAASCGLSYWGLFGTSAHPNDPTSLPTDEIVDWLDSQS